MAGQSGATGCRERSRCEDRGHHEVPRVPLTEVHWWPPPGDPRPCERDRGERQGPGVLTTVAASEGHCKGTRDQGENRQEPCVPAWPGVSEAAQAEAWGLRQDLRVASSVRCQGLVIGPKGEESHGRGDQEQADGGSRRCRDREHPGFGQRRSAGVPVTGGSVPVLPQAGDPRSLGPSFGHGLTGEVLSKKPLELPALENRGTENHEIPGKQQRAFAH